MSNSKTLVHISDLHLSRTHAYTFRNWQAVLRYINETQPDLVINTGDYVLNEPGDTDDLVFGREQMERVAVPWKSLPGDHDIGGGPPQPRLRPEVPWLEHYFVTAERHAHYLSQFQEDHWAITLGDWYLIGINDLIFESGFEAETAQWEFLNDHLVTAAGRPTALFMHKPLCIMSLLDDAPVTNAIPPSARARLRDEIADRNVRLFCCGHQHVFRTFQTQGITVIVAPTIMRGQDDYASTNGQAVNGLVEYKFEGESVAFRLIEPSGIAYPTLPEEPRHEWPELLAEEIAHD